MLSMNYALKNKQAHFSTFILNHEWHSRIIGFLVGSLMVCIYLWILGGIFNLLYHLYTYTLDGWAHGAEIMIKQVVIMLAAFELIRTLQSYLTLGRVKVTFILDAALVVLIGELISLWYDEYKMSEIIINISVISILTILRIITTKYSPNCQDES
ncbi:MAG: phosphate-starvation-inducible PsiE family protein [Gammaproteobacteria bacterium]